MTQPSDDIQIVWGHKTPNIERKLHDILPWIHRAGRPYYDVLFEGVDTEDILAKWLDRRSSELSLRRMRLAVVDDRIGGGYVACAGSDLPGCRQADILDLARSADDYDYSDLRQRIDDLSGLFAPVEAHDFYLSKLGVLPRVEDHPVERALIDDCIQRARHGGFGRVRTDVAEGDDQMGLFEAYDFEPIYRGKSKESGLCYRSMVLDV